MRNFIIACLRFLRPRRLNNFSLLNPRVAPGVVYADFTVLIRLPRQTWGYLKNLEGQNLLWIAIDKVLAVGTLFTLKRILIDTPLALARMALTLLAFPALFMGDKLRKKWERTLLANVVDFANSVFMSIVSPIYVAVYTAVMLPVSLGVLAINGVQQLVEWAKARSESGDHFKQSHAGGNERAATAKRVGSEDTAKKGVVLDWIKKQFPDEESAIMILRGSVYALGEFPKTDPHPGGEEVLFDQHGKDGTDEFNDVEHSDKAIAMMKDYCLGTVAQVYQYIDENGGAENAPAYADIKEMRRVIESSQTTAARPEAKESAAQAEGDHGLSLA